MTPKERQERIANIIRQQNRATVNELARALKISRETIRRDLTVLARTGTDEERHRGLTFFLVETDRAGVTAEGNRGGFRCELSCRLRVSAGSPIGRSWR